MGDTHYIQTMYDYEGAMILYPHDLYKTFVDHYYLYTKRTKQKDNKINE